jgi:hypothetical protein
MAEGDIRLSYAMYAKTGRKGQDYVDGSERWFETFEEAEKELEVYTGMIQKLFGKPDKIGGKSQYDVVMIYPVHRHYLEVARIL